MEADFSLVTNCSTASPVARVIAMFLLFWPFIVLGFLRTRGRSSAPLTAMMLPFAIAACGMWVGFMNILRGAAISGGGTASMAAGTAEALMMLVSGAFSAGAVAIAALIRRHRPVADRAVLILATLTIANAVAAIVFQPTFPGARIGAVTVLAIAIALAVWLFVVARTIVDPRPLPRYAFVVVASVAIVGIIAWQRAEAFKRIAMGL